MFRIQVAPRFHYLQCTIIGFFTAAEVRDYAAAMAAAHRRYLRFAASYRLAIDVREAKIQSRDVLDGFADHIAGFPRAERIGVVTGHSLNRFQVLRILDRPYLRMVDTIEEAQSWAAGAPLGADALQDCTHGAIG